MSTRTAKQLIYGALYLLIWLLIIWVGYRTFSHPVISCFDGIQNQGELGVDCGGPCSKVCSGAAQPVSVLSVNAFTASSNYDTFLAKIANTNSGYAAQSFDYAFNLYDSSGTVIQSFPGQSFLYPSEVKYLLLPNQEVPTGVSRFDLTVTNVNWVTPTTMGSIPQVAVQNIATQIGSSTALATGQVANNDVGTFSNVLVIGIFKDSNGNPIGASQTEIDSIAPTEVQSFSVSYPAIVGIDPGGTEVEAYVAR